MPATRVLLRTEALVFVDKPAGLLVHCSAWAGPRERALVDDVEEALGPGWHPLHRLDRQTSGVVAFAREGTVSRWQAIFAEADKRYWALVRGHVRTEHEVDHAIVDEDGTARPARSHVMPLLISSVERCSLVEVRIFTGRRHQVRRHLKHISHPVIGDASHGKGPINRDFRARYGVHRMALHARSLALADVDGVPLRVVAPLPDDLRAPFTALFGADAVAWLDE